MKSILEKNLEAEQKEVAIIKPFDIDKAKKELEPLGQKISELIKQVVELESHKLRYFRVTQNTVSPMLLNTTGTREAFYKDGLVYVGNEKLYFQSDADEALAQSVLRDGDEMFFYTSYPYFHVAKKDDYNKHQEKRKELQKAKQNKHTISSQYEAVRRDIEKYEFWEQYDISFEFVVDIKPVLSGLTENSWGNGCNRATVYHIRLKENINQGRLKREDGDYLCSQQTGNAYYNTWNADINELQNIVTCKQCLKRIKKYKKS